MDNEKLFNLMEKMYIEMHSNFKEVRADINGLKSDVTGLKADVKDLKAGQLRLEDRLEDTSKTLFDGYMQNTERLTRIEEELSKHEEVIIRRVK